MHWMRQRHEALWHTDTHNWRRQENLAYVRGMNISRHWSRHAFRDVPKAQYTFKSLLVHGILQFTMLITLRCALHRCSSRDIRRWKLCKYNISGRATKRAQERNTCVAQNNDSVSDKGTSQCWSTTREQMTRKQPKPLSLPRAHKESSQWVCWFVWMILPQVHLRKPCYDFSFL